MSEDMVKIQEPEAQQPEHATAYDPEGFFTPAVIRHNMIMMIFLEAILMTGSKDLMIALQPLLNYLTDSYTLIGTVLGLTWVGVFGSVLTPYITRFFPYKKWYYITSVTLWAAIPIILGLTLVFIRLFMDIPTGAVQDKSLLKPLLYLSVSLIVLFQLIGGFTNIPHNEFLASCIPPTHRGRMFGISSSIYSLIAAGATALGTWMLTVLPTPASYGYIFIMTGAIWMLGFTGAAFAKEKRTPVEKSPTPWTWTMFKGFLSDRAYMSFIIFFTLTQLTFIPIYTLIPNYGLKELGMPDNSVGKTQFIGLVLTILSATPSGWLIDKFTPKRVIPACMFISGLGFLLLYLYYKPLGIYASYAIISVPLLTYFCSCTILTVSIPKPENRAGYMAVQALIGLAFFGFGPMFGGALTDWLKSAHYTNLLSWLGMSDGLIHSPWMNGVRLLMLVTALIAFAFYPLSKRMFRLLGDNWKSYS